LMMRKLMARKHVHALSHRNVVPTESHSNGKNVGYFSRTLWTVPVTLGYSEPLLFIRTPRLPHGNSCLWHVSYPVFIPKPSTHHMHDPGSIVPHIRPKVFTENQMSRIKYNYYYINSVSNDYDDSERSGTVEDSITPQE
jgi:hypothetical protein